MPPPRRTSSLVRGSGHSMQGTRPQRGSMIKGKRGNTAGQSAVYDMILLNEVSEDHVIHNLSTLFNDEIIYVSTPHEERRRRRRISRTKKHNERERETERERERERRGGCRKQSIKTRKQKELERSGGNKAFPLMLLQEQASDQRTKEEEEEKTKKKLAALLFLRSARGKKPKREEKGNRTGAQKIHISFSLS